MSEIFVYICGNAETICDDCDGLAHDTLAEIADEGIDAAIRALAREEQNGVELRVDRIFQHWHGGKFSRYQCGHTVGDDVYGYTTGLIATPEKNPTAALISAMDLADAAMRSAVEEAAEAERQAEAEWQEQLAKEEAEADDDDDQDDN